MPVSPLSQPRRPRQAAVFEGSPVVNGQGSSFSSSSKSEMMRLSLNESLIWNQLASKEASGIREAGHFKNVCFQRDSLSSKRAACVGSVLVAHGSKTSIAKRSRVFLPLA